MSSFRKRIVRHPIPGTQTSPQTGQVITSSGNPSLDVILGGGLPIGSICLIEEDKFATYSKVLAKYFMAEGVLSEQSVFVGSLDDTPKELIRKLPQRCLAAAEEENSDTEKNGLRIAWRYNDLPIVNSERNNQKIGHNFNLMELMDQSFLIFAHTITWSDSPQDPDEQGPDDWELKEASNDLYNKNDNTYQDDSSKEIDLENSDKISTPNPTLNMDDKEDEGEDKSATVSAETSATSSIPTPSSPMCKEIQLFNNAKYSRLLKKLQTVLGDEKFHSGGFLVKRSLCRICITSLGSPLWYDDNFGEDLLKFLTILRAIVRSSVSVCFITMPMHLIAKYDNALVPKIRNLVDYSIELESFAGSDKETNPAFKEYNGLFHLRKMAAINTLSAYMPETTDLAFKLNRKKFVIQNLHLPPELQNDATDQEDAKPTNSCAFSNLYFDL